MSKQYAPGARRHLLALLGLILIAFALRVYELDAQSFWYDEGVTAQVAQLGVGELARWTAGDIQPPLYYLFASGWLKITPFGELILRFPSALFGTLLIPILWALGRRLWNERAGLLAALVATTSPLLVYYSQEARMYTLLVLLVSLAALLVIRLLERGKERQWRLLAGYVFVALTAMYTHYFAGFALLALVLYWGHVWWRAGRSRHQLLEFLAANVIIFVGYLPWLPAMLKRFTVDSSYWSGTLKLGDALLDIGINFTTGATEVMLEGDAVAWLSWFGLAAIFWLVTILLGGHRGRQRPLMLLLLWGLLPLLLILALAYRTPKFNARYLMVSWPVWALLAGGGTSLLWNGVRASFRESRITYHVLRFVAVASLIMVLLAHSQGLRNWYTDDNFAKSAWREAISYMYNHRLEDEAVMLVSGHAYPVFDTYVPQRFGLERIRLPELEILDVNETIGWEQAASALNETLANNGGVWLFLWQDEVVDPTDVTISLLDRYAEPQAVPDYAYLDLRHYRFPPGQTIPIQPPGIDPDITFDSLLRLHSYQNLQDGIWFYWQALQPDLPDLQVAITMQDAQGQILFEEDMRPVGYKFPTSHWQTGEIYPVWLPLSVATDDLQIHMLIYDADSGEVLGEETFSTHFVTR